MFDLGWTEMGVVALVALLVLGPKELPNALRTVTNLTKTARRLAAEFQQGVNEIVREADLEDARKLASGINKNSISKAIEKTIDPTGEMKTAVKNIEDDVKAEARLPNPTLAPVPSTATPALESAAESSNDDDEPKRSNQA